MQELTVHQRKTPAVTRMLWNDYDECRSECFGEFKGNIFSGSFVMYVCDKPDGHERRESDEHYDSHMMTHWQSGPVEVGS